MINPGELLRIFCSSINPPKPKFVVCVSSMPLFFFINSSPRRNRPGADIFVEKNELPFLDHDSYISTGLILNLPQFELNQAQNLGTLPDSINQKIRDVVSRNSYLTETQKQVVLKNFRSFNNPNPDKPELIRLRRNE